MQVLAGHATGVTRLPSFRLQSSFTPILVGVAIARVLRWGPLARLGMVSYGVYLLHLMPLLALAFAGNRLPELPCGIRVVVVLATAWGLAELSFPLVERRLLRLKDRWR